MLALLERPPALLWRGPKARSSGEPQGRVLRWRCDGLAKKCHQGSWVLGKSNVSATSFTLAAAEVAERINAGEQVRQDEFFSDNRSGRSEGEEVWESILMKSQREPEEKKLPYMAHLLANLAFDPGIGSHMAHQVTKTAEQLTYRQLCILKLIMVKEQYALRKNDYRKPGGTFPAELYQLFYEYYDLHNRGYFDSGTGTMLGLTDLNPSAVKLQGLGLVTFQLMRLSAIPEADVLPIVEQLK